MIILFIRTIILYFFSVFLIRLMGKRQIGELQPHELVMTFMISDLASISMQDMRYPLILALLPMVTLLIMKVILTELELKNIKFRRFMDGKPAVIINNGHLVPKILKNQKLNIYDILEEIREKGFLDINEIEYAILENNGDISIFPKEEFCAIQKKDLNIKYTKKVLPEVLLFEGKIQEDSLSKIKRDPNWLKLELEKINFNNPKSLYLVLLTSNGKLFVQEKEQ